MEMFSLIEKLGLARRAEAVEAPGPVEAPAAVEAPEVVEAPEPPQPPVPSCMIQGYLDERTTRHAAGWMRNLLDPDERLEFEVVVAQPDSTRMITRGRADQFSSTLQKLGVGDGRYGFRIEFPTPLTAGERDHVVVRSAQTGAPLEQAPRFQGYVDERSDHHVAGWVRDLSDPAARVAFEVVLADPAGEQVLARGRADQPDPALAQLSVGDAAYGFRVLLKEPLSPEERDRLQVRPAGTTTPLELAPSLRTTFEPISHVAMDIVNNCNLRCPFCVYDYSDTRHTRVMSDATFDAALRLIPYVSDGNFWLSCLHEATMHPDLMRLIDRVPAQWRHKVMYTTNLARPMPDRYYAFLADSGLHHLNLSLESLRPEIYERMRKGARWRIFASNWDRLIDALRVGSAPPRLRYNIMAYRSNLAEIPDLVGHLLNERLAWQVEIRHTFDVVHIPPDFRDTEFLGPTDWAWLAEKLSVHAADQVLLLPPPQPDPVPDPPPAGISDAVGVGAGPGSDANQRPVTHPLNIRLQWDGRLVVYGEWTGSTGLREHEEFVVTNVHHLRDPRQFLTAL